VECRRRGGKGLVVELKQQGFPMILSGTYIVRLLLIALLTYFFLSTFYLLAFAVLGKMFYRQKKRSRKDPVSRFCIFIPSYHCEEVAAQAAAAALEQKYPSHLFKVVVIADGFSDEGLERLRETGATPIPVSFRESTKTKSLNAAFAAIDDPFEYVVILDVDNVMQANALLRFDQELQNGVQAIQAHRTAKNMNTSVAVLDAISEEINNTIFRKGQRAAGFTSAIIGSGMVFPYGMLRDALSGVDAVGGFDKELEMILLQQGVKVEYLDDVRVYDEKVDERKVLRNQRRRWISAQIHYMGKYFGQGVRSLFSGELHFFMKYIQMLLLPRLVQVGLLAFCTTGSLLILPLTGHKTLLPATFATFLLINIFTLVIAVPREYFNSKTFKALLSLPATMLMFIFLIFRLKGANKTFIHTPHSVSQTE
jgi:cellulose synthase/poly-beta-1,6-N-acetylglucosamine synthase-like glycosyltransferase